MNGLRSDPTLMAVSMLQRQFVVKPALYTKLTMLNEEINIARHEVTPTPKAQQKPLTRRGAQRHTGGH